MQRYSKYTEMLGEVQMKSIITMTASCILLLLKHVLVYGESDMLLMLDIYTSKGVASEVHLS